jgi:TrmH family RNA methyltransferase
MLVKAKAKYIQSLGQKKHRDSEGRFIAEGPKIVSELLDAAPNYIDEVYVAALDGRQTHSKWKPRR